MKVVTPIWSPIWTRTAVISPSPAMMTSAWTSAGRTGRSRRQTARVAAIISSHVTVAAPAGIGTIWATTSGSNWNPRAVPRGLSSGWVETKRRETQCTASRRWRTTKVTAFTGSYRIPGAGWKPWRTAVYSGLSNQIYKHHNCDLDD